MVSSKIKKEVINDWKNTFPQLSNFSSSTLLMKLDVALIGLSLERLPRCDEYRPLLICYPLWKSNFNENILIPIFTYEILDKKNAS